MGFRSTSTAQAQTTSTFSVTKPTGVVNGDVLVAFQVTKLSGGTNPATPTGWANQGGVAYSSSTIRLNMFTRVSSSDGASYTFNNAGGGAVTPESSVRIIAVSLADISGLDVAGASSGTGTSADPGSQTSGLDNELIVSAWASTGTGVTITPNVTFAALGTIGSASVENMNCGYKLQSVAGTVTNRDATLGSSAAWGAVIIGIPLTSVFVPSGCYYQHLAGGPSF